MAAWKYACKTMQGMELDLKLLGRSELSLNLVRAMSGSGSISPTQLITLTDIISPVQKLHLLGAVERISEKVVRIPVVLKNDDVSQKYDMHQLGIYAEDPDVGEILYIVLQSDEAEQIPSSDEMKDFTLEWYLNISVGNADNVKVVVEALDVLTREEGDARYALYDVFVESTDKLQKSIADHLADQENPHKTDKGQVGLGNVDNTSDMDKPVSTAQLAALMEQYAQLTAYMDKAIADLIGGAPSTLDTLKEIADAMEDNQGVVDALNRAVGLKANQTELDQVAKEVRQLNTDLGNAKTNINNLGTNLATANTAIGKKQDASTAITTQNIDNYLSGKQNNIKRTIISCEVVASSNTGLIAGSHYAALSPDYSSIKGTILSTDIVMLGNDSTQGSGNLTKNTALASISKDSSGKIARIGVLATGSFTVRASISVLYV